MMKMKNGDRLNLHRASSNVWLLLTEEEIQALRDRDAAAGRWHDDGGEPIIYGPYGGWPSGEKCQFLSVTVTNRRPKWIGWSKRPKRLCAGWCKDLRREILFQLLV